MKYSRRSFIYGSAIGLTGLYSGDVFSTNSNKYSMPDYLLLDSDEEKYWTHIRKLFTLSSERIYLNNGTMGPSPLPVIDSIHRYMRDADELGNYGGWEKTAEKLAQFLGSNKDEIALTHNVTEGINIACWGFPLKKGDEVILTNHEHVGNAGPWLNRAKLHGIVIKVISPGRDANETLTNIIKAVTNKTKVIAVPHIPCTQGQIFPIKDICKFARENKIFSFVDGAHGPGMIPLNLHDLDCDVYASCCHKWMLGPKGTGFLYVKKDFQETLQTYMVGGNGTGDWNLLVSPPVFAGYTPDAHRYYYGTQNLALYKGVDAAIDFINSIGMDRIHARITGMATYFQNELLKLGSKITMLTPTEPVSRGAVIGFRIAGIEHNKFYELAAENKIRIRSVPENGLNSLRVSTHIYNNYTELEILLNLIKKV